jgi:hypothetical protein
MTLKKFIGAADILVAKLDASNNPLAFINLGEVPVFEIDPTEEFAESFKTSKTGPNRRDLRIGIKDDLQVHLTLSERQLFNLEMAAFGESSSEVAGSYTGNEAFPPGIVITDGPYLVPGGHVGVSNLVVKDSAGSPVVVATTKYAVNPDAPLVTFLDVTGFTQPFKAFSYDYVKSDRLKIMSKQSPPLYVIADGKNLAVSGERAHMKLYKISFAPATKISMKAGSDQGTGNAFSMFELVGVPMDVPGVTEFGEYRVF